MIYFIQDAGVNLIKIGFTKQEDVSPRLSRLQTGCPSELVLLATMPGDIDEEKRLHRQFHKSRVRGEWFKPNPDLIKLIGQNLNIAKSEAPQPEKPKAPNGFDKASKEWPEALAILEKIKTLADIPDYFCANGCWYGYGKCSDLVAEGGIKHLVVENVGDVPRQNGVKSFIATPHAYDAVYDTLYNALPDCRGRCSCSVVMGALL